MTSQDPFPPKEEKSAAAKRQGDAPSLLTHSIEMATSLAATQMRLLSTYFGMIRNFQRTEGFAEAARTGSTSSEKERQPVIEIQRDGKAGIDLKFGSIAYKKEEAGSIAVALVDVLVNESGAGETRVQMELKVPSAPDSDSILGVTEKCRTQIVSTLRAAADTFDATTAEDLVFHESNPRPAR